MVWARVEDSLFVIILNPKLVKSQGPIFRGGAPKLVKFHQSSTFLGGGGYSFFILSPKVPHFLVLLLRVLDPESKTIEISKSCIC